jgi:hypothetical protein
MSDTEAVDGMRVGVERGGLKETRSAMRRELRGNLREWAGPGEGVRVNYGLYTEKDSDGLNWPRTGRLTSGTGLRRLIGEPTSAARAVRVWR